jgi:predicted homoserine dehydrogenase-like protein
MIIVDKALERLHSEGKPIRVGMVGAGFMGRGIALQIITSIKGMSLAAISNRNPEGARRAYKEAGVDDVSTPDSLKSMEEAISQGKYAITDNPEFITRAGNIDAVIEVTGDVEFGARVALSAIENGKDLVIMNAELDSTIGPIMKVYADKRGVVLTNADGDQPGVILNLYRFVKGIGLRPVLCGNIKGLQDPYRNPTTQRSFAEKWKQKPHMVTSFADGSKISFEQSIVANATGMKVARRGMFGPTVQPGTFIRDAVAEYPLDAIMNNGTGIVDYVVGAEPSPGIFVLATMENPIQKHYLNLYKLGTGPLYTFYTPYHLCHFEVPNTVARAVLFGDAAITPLGAPHVDVVATAKTDLKAGQQLDGIGHYMTYGQCENADIVKKERLLPMGLAEGCRLKRDISRDDVLTYEDVELPAGRLSDRLRAEQDAHFGSH